MTGTEDPSGLRRVLDMWVDTENKVRILVFYRRNPGVLETLEGLAQRLAIPQAALERELKDHVDVGLLRERQVGDKRIYVLDRERFKELEELVEEGLNTADRGGHAA